MGLLYKTSQLTYKKRRKRAFHRRPWEDNDGHDVADEAEDRNGRQEDALNDEAEGRVLNSRGGPEAGSPHLGSTSVIV